MSKIFGLEDLQLARSFQNTPPKKKRHSFPAVSVLILRVQASSPDIWK